MRTSFAAARLLAIQLLFGLALLTCPLLATHGKAVALAGVKTKFGSGFEDAALIELIQRHSADYAAMSVPIGPALVTGVRTTASDVDSITAGFQAGPLSEVFEGVLVLIGPVVATASSAALRGPL